nr:MAG TPA: hypothetical protein [Caudoviricetes sp.]
MLLALLYINIDRHLEQVFSRSDIINNIIIHQTRTL